MLSTCTRPAQHGSGWRLPGERRPPLLTTPCTRPLLTNVVRMCNSPRFDVPQVTRAVFEAANGGLKVVGRAGVGVDNVDLGAATEVSQYQCRA